MKKFILILMLPFSICASEVDYYSPISRNNESSRIETLKTIVIFNHATSDFDSQSSSKPGVIATNQFATAHNLPQFLAVGSRVTNPQNFDYEGQKEFLRRSQIDYVIESNSGTHQLHFIGPSHIIYAGGYFSECLCQSIRDTIRNIESETRNLRITLVADAIYEDTFKVIDFRVNADLPYINFGSWAISLDKIILGMEDEFVAAYFSQEILGNLQKFCPRADTSTIGPLKISNYTWSLSLNNRKIETWNKGQKEIEFNIVTSDQLDKILD